jgi:hypothetical protein
LSPTKSQGQLVKITAMLVPGRKNIVITAIVFIAKLSFLVCATSAWLAKAIF